MATTINVVHTALDAAPSGWIHHLEIIDSGGKGTGKFILVKDEDGSSFKPLGRYEIILPA